MSSGPELSTRKLNIWLPLLFSVVLVSGMVIGTKMNPSSAVTIKIDQENTGSNLGQGRLEELLRYIEAKYVDEVDSEALVEKAINGIITELDPHSHYIPASELREVNEQLEGNFEGVGIEFMVLDDTILVVSPIAGGPSEAVGIMAGDRIIEIEDSLVAGKALGITDVVSKLRGKKGSPVRLSVLRPGEQNLLSFTVTRDKIPMNSIDVAYMLDETTGYIKINRFSATTYKEYMKGLEELVEKQRMKDLVIDLRQNPGGYLQEATNILSQIFEDRDKLLVYTEGRSVNRNEYESTGKNFFAVGKVAVLVDEGSASASEIVAGAIQDWDRGLVIGRRTFGKGLVQEQYDLKDGSALRLTVARYFTPSNRSIQKSYEDKDNYDSDLMERFESGELYNRDSILITDSTKYYTAAGRLVYGGGGIVPDVFIALDTLQVNKHYVALRQHVPQFVFRYYNQHKGEMEYDLNNFQKHFDVNDALVDDFVAYADEKGVAKNPVELEKTRLLLEKLIKARLAKHLFGDKGFFTVWYEDDPAIMKALESFQEENPLSASKK